MGLNDFSANVFSYAALLGVTRYPALLIEEHTIGFINPTVQQEIYKCRHVHTIETGIARKVRLYQLQPSASFNSQSRLVGSFTEPKTLGPCGKWVRFVKRHFLAA